MKVGAAVLGVILCASCTADSPAEPESNGGSSRASPSAEENPDPVQIHCDENIAGVDGPPTDRSDVVVVHNAIELPSTKTAALQTVPDEPTPEEAALPGDDWLWAKQGIGLLGGQRIRLAVVPEASDDVRIGWGWAPIPRSTVVKAECPRSASWRAFPGGFWVREPGCYGIRVRVNDHPAQRVDVGIGKPCPGQLRSPDFATGG